MISWVLVFSLIALLVFIELLHAHERRDLYSRLMARDLREYVTAHYPREKGRSYVHVDKTDGSQVARGD